MDAARVVEVWVPAAGRVGSGYLLADCLVLTSYHVVQGLAPGDGVEVRPLEVPQHTPWLAATLCWPHDAMDLDAAPEQDAALLVIDAPPTGAGPLVGMVRFGQITGQDRVPCQGLGFPDAEARPGNRRDTMPVRGHLDALQARRSGMLTVHVDEGIVPRRPARGSGWAGSSGTALFCGSLLVGVLATDRALADDASVLGAVPITALADLPGFQETLTAHGVDLRLERASPAARRLETYLAAARRAASEHPYAGVLPGTTPPLAAVYLRQQIRRLGDEFRASREVTTPAAGATPADDVLADPPTCVILSGPGGGKSSLLRTRLASGVERWLDGRGENVLPVMVPAAALVAPTLTEALATAVAADLGLVEKLPAAFFETSPRPGARWLVLVDGLDEVADPIQKGKVLGKLAQATSGEYAYLYRFVIATRPLPGNELDTLGTGVPRYELQPFDDHDLESVARRWFHAASLPDPVGTARRFVQALDRSQLAELARVPLMTAMLCQLHADAPDQPLPTSRGHIYRKFITLLLKRQLSADAPGARHPGLERYPHANAQADLVLENLLDLIAFLAAERHSGNTLPAIVIAQTWSKARCPRDVLAEDWRTFLDSSLRRSGLLTTQDDDLVFLHQTLLEYLAARHHMDDPHTGKKALRDVFHQRSKYRPAGSVVARMLPVSGRKYWGLPEGELSYVGFLLDGAHHSGLTTGVRYLRRLTRGPSPRLEIMVDLHGLGTTIPNDVLRTTADRLHRLARRTWIYTKQRIRLAKALVDLGDARAADLLYTLAHDTTLDFDRVQVAEALAGLGDPRAADLLHTLAHDITLGGSGRVSAGKALAGLEDPRAADLLHTVAHDTSLSGWDRVQAAEALAGLTFTEGTWSADGFTDWSLSRSRCGDPSAGNLLYALARDATLDRSYRLEAAEALAALGDLRAASLLHPFASDTTLDTRDRVKVAEALAGLRDPHAADLLHALAQDIDLDGIARVSAAKALTSLGDPRAADVLHAFAHDLRLRDSAHSHRFSPNVWAAEALAGLRDLRAADILHALAHDIDLDTSHRVLAAKALTSLGDPRAADVLHAFARDTTLPKLESHHRMWAAEALAALGDPRAATVLYAFVRDSTLNINERRSAPEALAALGGPRAADLLYALARDTTPARGLAAEALASLGDSRGTQLLHSLARDTTSSSCVQAAEALAGLRDPRAATLLYALARDTTLDGSDRIRAADVLTRLGDPRAADLLYALARDATLGFSYGIPSVSLNVRAAEALAQLRDPRAADLLTSRVDRLLNIFRLGRHGLA
jgi:HEAT repeat protein